MRPQTDATCTFLYFSEPSRPWHPPESSAHTTLTPCFARRGVTVGCVVAYGILAMILFLTPRGPKSQGVRPFLKECRTGSH